MEEEKNEKLSNNQNEAKNEASSKKEKNEKSNSGAQDIKKDTSNELMSKLKKDLEEQKSKTDEYFEHLKRNMAEFDNFKKRTEKERDSMYGTITSDVVSAILPIMDNLESAINSECADEKYKSGVVMIYNQLKEALKKQGVEEIEALNKTFDPNFHEAVMHEEDENYGEKEVTSVLRKGYKIGEKVIRHSMVKVAN